MQANIKLYKNDGSDKKGLYPVKLIISDSKYGTRRKTLFKTDVNQWDEINQLPKYSHPNFEELFTFITRCRQRINSISFRNVKNINSAFDFILTDEVNDVDFYKYAQKRIQEMIDLNRHGNADAYQNAIKAIQKIKPELYFSEIDTYLIQEFIKYLKNKKVYTVKNGSKELRQIGLKNSTIRTYIKEIKAIYNSCLVDNRGLKDNRPFVGFTKNLPYKARRAKNIYIDPERLNILENNMLDVPYLERSRKLVLLQFYLCGLDFMDMYYLKKSQIRKGRLYFKRSKLGDRGYIIDVKVFDKAMDIIKEYKCNESEYIFPWRKDKTGYKTFLGNHIRDLRIVFEKLKIDTLPLNQPFGTKSVRHSFSTIGKFYYFDRDLIRELMGHERDDTDTIYSDKYPEEVRDEAHLKIITFK